MVAVRNFAAVAISVKEMVIDSHYWLEHLIVI